jgi:hypothetical protein
MIVVWSALLAAAALSRPPVLGPQMVPPNRAALVSMLIPPGSDSSSTTTTTTTTTTSRVSVGIDKDEGSGDDWSVFLQRERHERLRDIALGISVRRTVDEAELALKLAREYKSDPSILQDIDFVVLMRRLEQDLESGATAQLVKKQLMAPDEEEQLRTRQRDAAASLSDIQPEALSMRSGAVAEAVPKLRRVISKARELPLTIELPASLNAAEGVDFGLALNESKNVAVAVSSVWKRITTGASAGAGREEELVSLQKEATALLSLRAEVRGEPDPSPRPLAT